MRKSLRQFAWILILGVAGIVPGSARAISQPSVQDRDQNRDQDRDHDRDQDRNHDKDRDRDRYINNSAYQQGLREGFEDHDNHKHKRHRPHFDNKDDRSAYDKGYGVGYKGNDQYRPHDDQNRPH